MLCLTGNSESACENDLPSQVILVEEAELLPSMVPTVISDQHALMFASSVGDYNPMESQLHQIEQERLLYSLRSAAHTKLAVDILKVGLDRAGGNRTLFGNFPVG